MASAASNGSNDPVERMLRLLVQLKLQEIWGDKNQTEIILSLGQLGCTATEISDFTGAPMVTVSPTLSRARKKNGGAEKASRGKKASRSRKTGRGRRGGSNE